MGCVMGMTTIGPALMQVMCLDSKYKIKKRKLIHINIIVKHNFFYQNKQMLTKFYCLMW